MAGKKSKPKKRVARSDEIVEFMTTPDEDRKKPSTTVVEQKGPKRKRKPV
jgi:hypothetical protein